MSTDLSRLLPSQQMLRDAVADGQYRYIVWWGSGMSGKTVGAALAMVLKSVWDARDGISNREYIIANTSSIQVDRVQVPIIEEIAEQFGLPTARRLGYLDVAGAKFHIVGSAKVDSENAIRGINASGVWVDEATTAHPMFLSQADYRARIGSPVYVMTMNAGSPTSVIRQSYIKDSGASTLLISSVLDENIHAPEHIREALSDANHVGHQHARMVLNEWAPAGDLVYPGLETEDMDVLFTEEVIGLDWGHAAVTIGLRIVRCEDGTWLVMDEYAHDAQYQGRMPEEDHLRLIEGRWGAPAGRPMIVDPAASVFVQKAAQAGWGVWGSTNKDILRGIGAVQNMLTTGKLRVHSRCKRLIEQMQSYVWSPDTDKPVHKSCDGPDALRYAVMSGMLW